MSNKIANVTSVSDVHTCERCGKKFTGDWRIGHNSRRSPIRFCSKHCAKSYLASKGHEKLRSEGRLNEVLAKARSARSFSADSQGEPGYCRFCNRHCHNQNSLRNHERVCKLNPDRQILHGNNGNMPKHTKQYYNNQMSLGHGKILNVTRAFVDNYKLTHQVCEICGKRAEDAVKTKSKFGPHSLCVDHDHETMEFRGVLCAVCNRQLGWYEKNREAIIDYLSKTRPSEDGNL